MKKALNNHGESLIETLVSLLIIALCILMLQGSIVTAARVNKKTRTNIEPFELADSTSTGKKIKCNDKDTDIVIYKTKGGYYYYEQQ